MKNDWAVTLLAILALCFFAGILPSAQAARPEFPREVRHHPGRTHDQLPKKFDGKTRISHHYEGVDERGLRTLFNYTGIPKAGIYNLDREEAVQAVECTARGVVLAVTDDDAGDDFLNSLEPGKTILVGGKEWGCKNTKGRVIPFYYNVLSYPKPRMGENTTEHYVVLANPTTFKKLWKEDDFNMYLHTELVRTPRDSGGEALYTLLQSTSWNLKSPETNVTMANDSAVCLQVCQNCSVTWYYVDLTLKYTYSHLLVLNDEDTITASLETSFGFVGSIMGTAYHTSEKALTKDFATLEWIGKDYSIEGVAFTVGYTPGVVAEYWGTGDLAGRMYQYSGIKFDGTFDVTCTWDMTNDETKCERLTDIRLTPPSVRIGANLRNASGSRIFLGAQRLGVGPRAILHVGADDDNKFETSGDVSASVIPSLSTYIYYEPLRSVYSYRMSVMVFSRVSSSCSNEGDYLTGVKDGFTDFSASSFKWERTVPKWSAVLPFRLSPRQLWRTAVGSVVTTASEPSLPSEMKLAIQCLPFATADEFESFPDSPNVNSTTHSWTIYLKSSSRLRSGTFDISPLVAQTVNCTIYAQDRYLVTNSSNFTVSIDLSDLNLLAPTSWMVWKRSGPSAAPLRFRWSHTIDTQRNPGPITLTLVHASSGASYVVTNSTLPDARQYALSASAAYGFRPGDYFATITSAYPGVIQDVGPVFTIL